MVQTNQDNRHVNKSPLAWILARWQVQNNIKIYINLCDNAHLLDIGSAVTAGRAMDRAAEFAVSGAVVTAICRMPSNDVIVFSEQIERLRKIIAVREVMPDDRHTGRAA